MADVLGTTIISKDNDTNALTNPIFVNLSNGTTGVSIDAGGRLTVKLSDGTDSLDINADGSLNVQTDLDYAEDTAHVSGDKGVMALVVRRDTGSTMVSADGDYSPLQVDANGNLRVNIAAGSASTTQYAEDTAHASGDLGVEMLAVRRDTPVSGTSADGDYSTINTDADGRLYTNIHDGGNSITVDATDLDIRDLTHVTDSVKVGDGTDFIAVNADGSLNITDNGGSLTVDATNLDIRDLTLAQDAVQVSRNTTSNSAANPIFVQSTKTAITGEVHNYSTATVAAAGTSNHTYTATATFLCTSIIISASGKMKGEIQAGASGGPTTFAVAFVTPNTGTVQLHFDPPKEVAAADVLRIIRTNRENQSMDVYSTIIGIDA